MQAYIKANMWILSIVATLLTTGFFHLVVTQALRHLTNKIGHTNLIIAQAFFEALKLPLIFLIWLVGLSFSFSLLCLHFKNLLLLSSFSEIRKTGIIFMLCWTLVRFIRGVEIRYIEACTKRDKEVDKTLVHAAAQLLTIAVCIIGMLLIMQMMNIPIGGVLAFGGIGGAAVALAAKELFANFFGSLVIYMDRPFKVGDWIRSPDKNIEGTVEFIGWRMTRIRTFDKRPLYVPNGVFLTISVENPSRMLHRRIKTIIGVRYQDADKIDTITEEIRQMLINQEEIDASQLLTVSLVEFGPSSLNIMVSAYSNVTKWAEFQSVQHQVLMKILTIISRNGAECAFPSQTVYLETFPTNNHTPQKQMKAFNDVLLQPG
ncbi:mechanosensitive ion channel family protein [Legionella jamestowniensis]|uniref:Small-conductance mechanosensitive channel n=1 Tax=Legionella jamestowniensis TaxID=455 RepID=A0A0W0UGU0_9GAMM|nr:mechanosensitive ion channel family protein [Legionella jamestowniensis]KTD06940.1 small-conductance mechanosensitive channel [Legionella jamestowniensis]SFL84793.1 MscS family membrane protein [Legionella jamestowniensis DSM 19215]